MFSFHVLAPTLMNNDLMAKIENENECVQCANVLKKVLNYSFGRLKGIEHRAQGVVDVISTMPYTKKRENGDSVDKLNFYDLCKRTISSSFSIRLPNTAVVASRSDCVRFSYIFSFFSIK